MQFSTLLMHCSGTEQNIAILKTDYYTRDIPLPARFESQWTTKCVTWCTTAACSSTLSRVWSRRKLVWKKILCRDVTCVMRFEVLLRKFRLTVLRSMDSWVHWVYCSINRHFTISNEASVCCAMCVYFVDKATTKYQCVQYSESCWVVDSCQSWLWVKHTFSTVATVVPCWEYLSHNWQNVYNITEYATWTIVTQIQAYSRRRLHQHCQKNLDTQFPRCSCSRFQDVQH